MNAVKKHSYHDYLVNSLADPQEADAYFQALCEPDVSISEFRESVLSFEAVYKISNIHSFAALFYPKTQSWYWVILQAQRKCYGGYYSVDGQVVRTDGGYFDFDDWQLPEEQRLIKFVHNFSDPFLFAPNELMSEFEKVLAKRFYLKFPFC
jgi:hypothetical protein